MNISYTAPLSAAWERMQRMLFRPFRLEVWLAVGFAAFLANILGGGSSGSWKKPFSFSPGHGFHPSAVVHSALDRLHSGLMHVVASAAMLALILSAMVVGLVVLVVLGWLSARAKFVLLDQVANEHSAFLAPWRRYDRLGRSLFLWQAAFSFVLLVPVALIVWPFIGVIVAWYHGGDITWPAIGASALSVSTGVLLCILLAIVGALTREFVVPVMYRNDEGAVSAWGRFMPLLQAHPGEFFAWLVFRLVLGVGAGLAVMFAGFATCCIGLVLMAIPYVGSVILLPVTLTARAYGPEFLAQFGPEWDVMHRPAPVAPPAVPPDAPPVL